MSVKESAACHWSQDGEDSDVCATQCSHYFRLDADSPSEQGNARLRRALGVRRGS